MSSGERGPRDLVDITVRTTLGHTDPLSGPPVEKAPSAFGWTILGSRHLRRPGETPPKPTKANGNVLGGIVSKVVAWDERRRSQWTNWYAASNDIRHALHLQAHMPKKWLDNLQAFPEKEITNKLNARYTGEVINTEVQAGIGTLFAEVTDRKIIPLFFQNMEDTSHIRGTPEIAIFLPFLSESNRDNKMHGPATFNGNGYEQIGLMFRIRGDDFFYVPDGSMVQLSEADCSSEQIKALRSAANAVHDVTSKLPGVMEAFAKPRG